MDATENWWAEGLVFENCNCQLLCSGHLSYKNLCDHERCLFHWSIHIHDGQYGPVPLRDLNVFVAMDAPQHMITGGWTQAVYIDDSADEAQHKAIERIIKGNVGGPLAVLARFVSNRLETRSADIKFLDDDRRKAMRIDGLLETSVEPIVGADKNGVVRLDNVHNQVHAPSQVMALGMTRFSDRGIVLETDGTHGVYSNFSWQGP
ncbi:MAG: DUF1326 domain-containing protein [Rhodobacteraceae bacterium]|nr:DUF1326 domain-containing protein [Paracoccaceae bacterium]